MSGEKKTIVIDDSEDGIQAYIYRGPKRPIEEHHFADWEDCLLFLENFLL